MLSTDGTLIKMQFNTFLYLWPEEILGYFVSAPNWLIMIAPYTSGMNLDDDNATGRFLCRFYD